MTLWIATLLGIVQGVFMFVPVSSTAHLVLTQHWLIGMGQPLPPPESPEMILFDLVVHVGTLVSIVFVFWRSLLHLSGNIVRESWQWASSRGAGGREMLYLRLGLLIVLSVFATAVVGFTLKLTFERVFAYPLLIAGTLTLTGVLLWWTDGLSRRPRGLRQISPRVASVIGVAQGFALVPGLSRSGMTITFALFSGLKRRWAAEYSFFLAIPTILAATLVQSLEVFRADGLGDIGWAALTVGFVVSAVVGIVSLKMVLYFLYRAQLKVFSFYVWALALLVLFGFLDTSIMYGTH
ncbi:Undecaprenyl-diphosphatase [Thioalkalivibrio nitratireducens DSM 14787]|uniref:Undecaprenyl-diphosphatase n=1 Tax=Thioalkalivibrio nitratireducens (strain DSM 14787 / UNIQEM 213 / ALEN2) TaxID=1255043 RepID=L0DXY3_THIND|nr:undecaprenyl-diphosphate phosphatase [Thioalkalivibrio nitratireducens]AGA33883.1 Undecaprenyl-diphosphatase [Thioalkalivibrio nitratireducens DSM 14787]